MGWEGPVWSGLDDLVSEYIGFGGFSYDSYGIYAYIVNISDTDFSCGLTPRRMKVFPLDREKARQQSDRSKSYLFCIWWGSSDQKELWYFWPKSCVSNQALMLCLLRLLVMQIFTVIDCLLAIQIPIGCGSFLFTSCLQAGLGRTAEPWGRQQRGGGWWLLGGSSGHHTTSPPWWILWSPHHTGRSCVAMRNAEDPCQQLTPLDIL